MKQECLALDNRKHVDKVTHLEALTAGHRICDVPGAREENRRMKYGLTELQDIRRAATRGLKEDIKDITQSAGLRTSRRIPDEMNQLVVAIPADALTCRSGNNSALPKQL